MEASATALIPVVTVLALAATVLWVYQDATAHERRGTPVCFTAGSIEVCRPVVWALCCLCLWIFFMPLYLTSRRQAG
ncbi:hypothetical protein [Streptacidiphilus neutrinimicus]|uniref:hypothetical protein n=1 Tax=Streptacidiphilus neutrinimicus TaxID=105420 RepID=UPI0005A9E137|nr:hypothetical protein [Streptacidiphilus neutrinimicus]